METITNDIQDFIKFFGKFLKYKRKNNREKLSNFCYEEQGISARSMGSIERGQQVCKIDTLYKICKYYDCSLSSIFQEFETYMDEQN